MEEQKIIHIAQIPATFEYMLDKVIEGMKVDIGPKLGSEVAYR